MPEPMISKSSKGEPMHYSVGAIVKKDGKYLLIDRAEPPYGFAGLAGHVDEDEEPLTALKREVNEESGLTVLGSELLYEEEVEGNLCRRGINTHYWYLYQCDVTGDIVHNERETKSIKWYSPEEIKDLGLEPVWEYWFKKLKII